MNDNITPTAALDSPLEAREWETGTKKEIVLVEKQEVFFTLIVLTFPNVFQPQQLQDMWTLTPRILQPPWVSGSWSTHLLKPLGLRNTDLSNEVENVFKFCPLSNYLLTLCILL